MGPQVDGGTLMLVGGRRVLISADGSTKAETAPSPEPLQQIIVVPVAGGAKRFIARGTNGLYRLDDLLGAPRALAQSESEIRSIGAFVGLVVLWTHSAESPRFVDVETGKFKVLPTLPPLPIRAVAFRNDKEGAAIFEGVGVAVTNDGGSTWKRVSEDVNGDALRMQGLSVRDGALYGYVYEDGMASPIDVATSRMGRAVDPPTDSNASPLVRWVRKTGTDPIATAAQNGVEIGEGAALVASNGLIARVDLKTGTITALEEFGPDARNGVCPLQRAGNSAWLACPIAEQPNSDVYDPFGIMRVSLDGNSIKPERPSIIRSGEAEMRTSPSGGVMVLGQCSSDDSEGEVCVRQPDGRWTTVSAEVELSSRAAGPLSDGRVAFLRNMWNGDKPDSQVAEDEPDEEGRTEAEESEDPVEDREDRVVPDGKRLYVAAVGAGRKEERIATISWRSHGDVRVQSPIQEDDDHNLHFIIADDDGVYAVVQPMDKEARTPQRLEGITEARLRGSRGIAVGLEGIRASTDGGRTWAGLPLPTRARDTLMQIESIATDPTTFGVSEVGMLLDKTVRIGWGATDNIEDPIEPVFDSTLPSISRVSAPERTLSCTVEANVQGTPPLANNGMIPLLFGKKTPAPKGTKRTAATTSSTRDGVMGVVSNFEEEGSDKPGALPAKWTFNWFDPTELGGKPRSWSGAPPKDTPWGAQVRAVVASGARAVFTLRVGGKNIVLRTKTGGGVETAEVGADVLPSSDAVFGTEKGEPIAWTRDNALVVWVSGEAPRIIGYVSYRSNRLLGEPTKDGVPVLLSAQDWSALRVFPIPVLDKKGPAPVALAPTLDGWTAAPNLVNHIGRFGTCTSKPKAAMHFTVVRSYARATMDAATGSIGNARYDVYLTGADACVARLSATHNPDRSSSRPPPGTTSVPNAPKKGPITFVRTDFIGKRAEGGARGLAAKDAMHKLTCTLEERK